jgi:phosphopantothenate-cysteine ligase
MVDVLVTAGGTVERIDPVRAIANTSTGRLGRLVAEAFLAHPEAGRVFYVAPRRAERPDDPRLEWIEVSDVASVEAALRDLLARERIGVAVHAMAVSDYRVRLVTTAARLAGHLTSAGREAAGGVTAADILDAPGFDRGAKIGSSEPDLVVVLEPTPKLIALFHTLSPATVLVGFKLLSGVPHAELMAAAAKVRDANHCAFVLANDATAITAGAHQGFLLAADGSVAEFGTKPAIAAGIVAATLGARLVP